MVKKSKNEKLEQRVKELEEDAVTEQTPKNFQRFLQKILDTIEGEVFVKDTNGKYLFVNKAFGNDFGVDPKAVSGKTIKTIPKKTMKALQDYHWPGNVRELSNVIESAMISSHDTTLRIPDMLETLKHGSKDRIVSMTEMEKDHIMQTLETCHWRIEGRNGAAELLGLNPGTLRGRMRKYGIKRP